jgi:hypothetical protein
VTTLDKHTATVYLGETALEAKTCRVKMDRGWAPFVQGDIVIPMTLGVEPRRGDRVQVLMRQTFGVSEQASALSAEFAGLANAAALSALWAGLTAADVSSQYHVPFGLPTGALLPAGDGFWQVPAGWVEDPPGSGLYPIPETYVEDPPGSGLYALPTDTTAVRAPTSRFLDLTIDAVATRVRDRETVLTVASDESVAQGFVLVQTVAVTFGTTSVRSIASQVLGRMGAYLLDGTADGTTEAAAATWEPGVSAWAFLQPLVQQAGLRLWCDGRRAWRLDADDALTAGTVALSSLDRVTDVDLGIDLDRGDWADAVVIRYEWRDEAGEQQVKYDVAGSNKPRRGILLTYEQPWPGYGAAAHVLRRRNNHGIEATVEAVSDYSTEPGKTFELTVAGMPERTGYVKAVEWRLPDAEMTVEPADLIESEA